MKSSCRGVIAAGHPLTAEAGAEMLRRGGNAFDAAIAATMAAWVTEPVLTGAGGGGFLLAHTTQGEDCLFDFFTQTPCQQQRNQPPDFYPIQANFGDAVQEFHIGLGSIAVPGCVAGLFHVHRRLGKLSMAEIAEPAIRYAAQGIAVNPFMAYCFDLLSPILTASEGAKAIYAPQGNLLKLNDILKMPTLAKTLKDLVEQGPGLFYEGAIAQQIIHDCQTQGGHLTAQDLSRYQVIERRPLSVCYRDTTFLTNPPPSSGGTLIAFALKLLEAFEPSTLRYGSLNHIQTLATAMKLANTARQDGYDSHLYKKSIAEPFLATEHISPYQTALQDVVNKWGSTTHISVLDAHGNAASVTTSNGEGSAYVVPDTQIMLNNMLGEADLHPHGFHQWQPNQRISSMMAPTILLKNGQPKLVIGSGGSNRIRTAILQVIINLLDSEMPLETAVNAPRLHWEQGSLHIEPGYPNVKIDQLSQTALGQICPWQQQNMFFGGVHAVAVDAQGHFRGAGDNRRGGSAIIL
ncbi:MAG: gamma-glutamyltransferase [Leptolyngbyaceae cyanobacterium]